MPPPGLAVALRAASPRRSRDRPAPGRAPAASSTSPSAAIIRSTEKSRLRGSIPITTGRSTGAAGEKPRQEADRQVVDRLEPEVLQRADRGRPPGARRAAHDDDVRPAQGVLPQPPCTPCPTRPLASVGKGAAVLHENRQCERQDLGDHARKSTQLRLPATQLSQGVAFVPRAPGRGRPPASPPPREPPAGAAARSPATSISPASGGRARWRPAPPRAAPPPPGRRPPAPRPAAPARSASADLPEPEPPRISTPRPAKATAEPCKIRHVRRPLAMASHAAALFRSVTQKRKQSNADPNSLAHRQRAFAAGNRRINPISRIQPAPPRVIESTRRSMLRCGSGVARRSGVPAGGRDRLWWGMHGMKTFQGAGRGQPADDARGHRLCRRGARPLQPARACTFAGGHRARRRRPRPGRRLPRLHRPPHRPQPQGQVRRPRALGRGRRSGGRTTPRWRPSLRAGSSPTCATHIRGAELFVQDLYAGADPAYRLNVRVITELAWHGLFIRHLLRRPAARGARRLPRPASPSSTARPSTPTRPGTAAAPRR